MKVYNEVVTTSRRPTPADQTKAKHLARVLKWPYVARDQIALPPSKLYPGDDAVSAGAPDSGRPFAQQALIVERDRLVLRVRGGELFYHPGMAHHRIRTLLDGGADHLIEAADLRAGDHFCDATTGLAADALVASFVVGETGRVVGVESVPVLAVILREGLKQYPQPHPKIRAAMRRIRIANADHLHFLSRQPDRSFDVVYFDPMFERPVLKSTPLAPLRVVADQTELRLAAWQEALRVARRRVVLKARQGSPLFEQVGCDGVLGGASSRVAYGYVKVGG